MLPAALSTANGITRSTCTEKLRESQPTWQYHTCRRWYVIQCPAFNVSWYRVLIFVITLCHFSLVQPILKPIVFAGIVTLQLYCDVYNAVSTSDCFALWIWGAVGDHMGGELGQRFAAHYKTITNVINETKRLSFFACTYRPAKWEHAREE